MRIVALDPGGTTGVAIYTHSADTASGAFHNERIVRKQLGPDRHHVELWKLLTSENPDVIVCESFEFRQFDKKDRHNIVLVSKEYIGIVELYCAMTGKEHKPQTASVGKAFWSDDKIKRLGLWVPGNPHSMDATRHLLHYLTFEMNLKLFLTLLRDTE